MSNSSRNFQSFKLLWLMLAFEIHWNFQGLTMFCRLLCRINDTSSNLFQDQIGCVLKNHHLHKQNS